MTQTERDIKEKLESVKLPDVDNAWASMDELLDSQEPAVASPVAKSALLRLLKNPIIWLNSILFALMVVVTSANFTRTNKMHEDLPVQREVIVPVHSANAVSQSQYLSTEVDNAFVPEPVDKVTTTHDLSSQSTLHAITESPVRSQVNVPNLDFIMPVFDLSWLNEKAIYNTNSSKKFLIKERDPVIFNWFVGADFGAFPEIRAKDFHRQIGAELGVLVSEGGIWSMQTSLAYNPVQIQGITRTKSYVNASGQKARRTEELQRLNFLTLRTGAYVQANPNISFAGGLQVSQLINMYGERTTTTVVGNQPTTEVISTSTRDLEGMERIGLGLYVTAEMHRQSWSGYVTVQQDFIDYSYDAYFGNSANHTFNNVRFGIRKRIGNLRLKR